MYFAICGKNTSLSVNDINAAPEAPEAAHGGPAFEQHTNPRLICGGEKSIQPSVEQCAVDEEH